ncbi:hypothetical protein CHS0354_029432 [Potamilus streckersoni]|uniref:Uncharacterized protein n=1 Tax=Potamilus streckersoni TaxID=2493646 RepID=A0AAE0W1C9_9BIVA|nr:hypothetical protein CHS0354_029432 [Potamilus streckersoni]
MLIRIVMFHLVTVIASGYRSGSADEMFQWHRSIHLKASENNQTVSNKLQAGDTISRTLSSTSGLKLLDTIPQTIETLSSTTGRVAEIGHGNGELFKPYQDFTQPRSTLLNYLLTWKGDGAPFTPDSVTSAMTSETTVTSVRGMQTDVISSSDGMLVDQWHRTLILKNGGENVTLSVSDDTSKMYTTEEDASKYNETQTQAHISNSIDWINSTYTFQNSRLHDMISITKFIIVTATVSCAVIVILALIFGISSCRKRKEITLRDVKDHSFQKKDSDLVKVTPHEDKDTYMGIPSNNQIWKELQIIEKSAAFR